MAREREVELGETVGGVGDEVDRHAAVDVRPLRVVVQYLGMQGDARHEAERFVEIPKGELSMQLAVDTRPIRQAGESFLDFELRKPLRSCHDQAVVEMPPSTGITAPVR